MKQKTLLFMTLSLALVVIAITVTKGTHSRPEHSTPSENAERLPRQTPPLGVCPPFHLFDEDGNLIDPIHGINADKPYSPRQTCGKCHDYEKITEGFHFQQGRGEPPPAEMAERYQWVTSPGVYGGNWCSPAPLYRQLARKHNTSARAIDMTSFDFITATCGNCHPGGGPLEFDRDGKRYDRWMKDPASGLVSGGENGLDGDYYKARWAETGVIEADCLICHLPEYDFTARNDQLANLNFKWAATAGSTLGQITGSIKDAAPVVVSYNVNRFDPDGKLSLHIVREPRSETCLHCHAKPGWKKRGATFSARWDVHIAAGLKCVDCHAAGSHAADSRIRGRENHQIGKGDDPSGHVRDDLDNTMRDCAFCHIRGYLNAPIAKHNWLPPLHLEKIACQTCHINERPVKAALVQASDVYNPGTKITPPPKYVWTFYDQEMKYWNHYGELAMFTAKDQLTDPFRPIVARYKGKIYPVNPVHSTWPGILTEGEPGLDHPTMKDVFAMWTAHRNDATQYPKLREIRDDNGDGVPEVNRPEEIDAFIQSVRDYLQKTGYDLTGKQVRWVNDDRVYTSGTTYQTLPKHEFESSPYASVYKFSHDVAPAKAALGKNGCTDCHSSDSPFFNAAIVKYPFGPDGQPITEPQYKRLGLASWGAKLGAWREGSLKPAGPWAMTAVALLCLFHFVVFGARRARIDAPDEEVVRHRLGERLSHAVALTSFLFLAITGFSFLLGKASPLGTTARMLHGYMGWVFTAGVVAALLAWVRSATFAAYDWQWLRLLGGYFGFRGTLPAGKFNAGQKIYFWFAILCSAGLVATGTVMFAFQGARSWHPLAYTIHDGLAILLICGVIGHFYLAVVANPGTLRGIFGGKVSAAWAQHHHPQWAADTSGQPGSRLPRNEEA